MKTTYLLDEFVRDNTLGQAVRDMRQRAGLSYYDMGQAGTDSYSIEVGKVQPRLDTLAIIAEVCGYKVILDVRYPPIGNMRGPFVWRYSAELGWAMGEMFRVLRAQHDLTQMDVMKRTGIHNRTVGDAEQSRGLPRLNTLAPLLKGYGATGYLHFEYVGHLSKASGE